MTPSTLEINFVLITSALLVAVIWHIYKQQKAFYSHLTNLYKMNESLTERASAVSSQVKRIDGQLRQVQVGAKIAEKFAERANTLASSSTIGIAILQRALQVRKIPKTSEQDLKNKHVLSALVKNAPELDDWLEPVMTTEEREIAEFARKLAEKESES